MNSYRELLEITLGKEMVEILIWTYSIAGGIFIICAFTVFIQMYVKFKIRGSLSILFLILGVTFLNLTGQILTGYTHHFTIATIITVILLTVIGAFFTMMLYRENKTRRIAFKRAAKRKKL